jgi:hypothetical protein
MPARCPCGTAASHAFEQFACLECGGACCRTCAVSVESAPYCRPCAGELLETSAPRGTGGFTLH